MRKGSKDKPAMSDSSERREPTLEGHNDNDDGLEAGVAAIFAEIQSGGFEELGEDDYDHGDATLILLAELNRIWASPAPG